MNPSNKTEQGKQCALKLLKIGNPLAPSGCRIS